MISINEFNKVHYSTCFYKDIVISARDIVEIGFLASRIIMDIYKDFSSELNIKYKDTDNSPVTIADLKSNEIICNGLLSMWPEIPIISEESKISDWNDRRKYKICWLIDPLDGTKEFIKRNGEFTVNIGLCENGNPTLGVVTVPNNGICYFSSKNLNGAYKVMTFNSSNVMCEKSLIEFIPKSNHSITKTDVTRILNSPNYHCPLFLIFKEKYFPDNIVLTHGSSIKFIEIIEGRADIYPRFHDCMEWDTCASHIIIQQTCGDIYEVEITKSESEVKFNIKRPLIYNKESLINPYFVAINEKVADILDKFQI
ncbi:3'(2'),5'-bisphosphate nucleotidase [Cryptosporidium felis]|nr:3'(2'),5'-bisphosphate nucleotidase [Cryptosporidium felis]